jgi:hypothetical protein
MRAEHAGPVVEDDLWRQWWDGLDEADRSELRAAGAYGGLLPPAYRTRLERAGLPARDAVWDTGPACTWYIPDMLWRCIEGRG